MNKNIIEPILKRRSVRAYKKGAEITNEQFDLLLEAAMMAPSARNTRPWTFIVVKERENLNRIMKAHPYTGMLSTASAAIIVCALPDAQEGFGKGFYPQDCGAATQNILLQAAAMGLGTCWCGVYPNEERIKDIRSALNIEDLPFNVIALGVSDEEPEARGFYDKSKVRYL